MSEQKSHIYVINNLYHNICFPTYAASCPNPNICFPSADELTNYTKWEPGCVATIFDMMAHS